MTADLTLSNYQLGKRDCLFTSKNEACFLHTYIETHRTNQMNNCSHILLYFQSSVFDYLPAFHSMFRPISWIPPIWQSSFPNMTQSFQHLAFIAASRADPSPASSCLSLPCLSPAHGLKQLHFDTVSSLHAQEKVEVALQMITKWIARADASCSSHSSRQCWPDDCRTVVPVSCFSAARLEHSARDKSKF